MHVPILVTMHLLITDSFNVSTFDSFSIHTVKVDSPAVEGINLKNSKASIPNIYPGPTNSERF